MKQRNLIDAGLVLEGGGTRSLFTAGVLDYLMEKDIYFKYIYSVSASAYVALSYISGQIRRTKESIIDYAKVEAPFSWKSFFKTGSVFDKDLLFNRLPNQIMPFDYETFFNSGQTLTMSLTDLRTGEPVYFNSYGSNEELMNMCCASTSFPIISKTQFLDGKPMTDGGMADAIPVRKAVEDGHNKLVVILTQQSRFRKKVKTSHLLTTRYFWHRRFVKTIKERPKKYNADLDYIENMVAEGNAIAFYPEIDPPRLICRDYERLAEFYEHGYKMGPLILEKIKEFFSL